MNHTRREFLAAVAGTAALGSTGCVGSINSSSGPSVSEISLLLNWKPNGLHVPYYAAKAEGFYDEEELTVSNIQAGQGSDFSAKQVGLGNNDFAITSSDQAVNVASRKLSPLAVGVVMQKSPVVVFTARENFGEAFTNIDQLEGKTVGTGPGMVRVLTKLLLERNGVRDSVKIVDTGYDTVQQLLAGKIDAAGGAFGDAVDARHQGYTTDSIPVASAVPAYGHVVATEHSFADENPDTVRAFLRATAHGAAWASNNPKRALDHLVDAVPVLSQSRASQRDTWDLLRTQYMFSPALRNHGWGWSNANPWRLTRNALQSADLLGGNVDPATVWTNDYLDTDDKYIGSYAETVSDSN